MISMYEEIISLNGTCAGTHIVRGEYVVYATFVALIGCNLNVMVYTTGICTQGGKGICSSESEVLKDISYKFVIARCLLRGEDTYRELDNSILSELSVGIYTDIGVGIYNFRFANMMVHGIEPG